MWPYVVGTEVWGACPGLEILLEGRQNARGLDAGLCAQQGQYPSCLSAAAAGPLHVPVRNPLSGPVLRVRGGALGVPALLSVLGSGPHRADPILHEDQHPAGVTRTPPRSPALLVTFCSWMVGPDQRSAVGVLGLCVSGSGRDL